MPMSFVILYECFTVMETNSNFFPVEYLTPESKEILMLTDVNYVLLGKAHPSKFSMLGFNTRCTVHFCSFLHTIMQNALHFAFVVEINHL